MSNLYSDIRSTIKSGDLLAWTHRSWGSFYDLQMQCIRIFTKSEYTHVGTAWVIGERVFVIEAVVPKVRIYPLSSLLPFYLIPLNSTWNSHTEEFLLAQVGDPYSVKQAIQSLFRTPDIDDNWMCGELVRETMIKEGIDLGTDYTPSGIVNKALSFSTGLRLIER